MNDYRTLVEDISATIDLAASYSIAIASPAMSQLESLTREVDKIVLAPDRDVIAKGLFARFIAIVESNDAMRYVYLASINNRLVHDCEEILRTLAKSDERDVAESARATAQTNMTEFLSKAKEVEP